MKIGGKKSGREMGRRQAPYETPRVGQRNDEGIGRCQEGGHRGTARAGAEDTRAQARELSARATPLHSHSCTSPRCVPSTLRTGDTRARNAPLLVSLSPIPFLHPPSPSPIVVALGCSTPMTERHAFCYAGRQGSLACRSRYISICGIRTKEWMEGRVGGVVESVGE